MLILFFSYMTSNFWNLFYKENKSKNHEKQKYIISHIITSFSLKKYNMLIF